MNNFNEDKIPLITLFRKDLTLLIAEFRKLLERLKLKQAVSDSEKTGFLNRLKTLANLAKILELKSLYLLLSNFENHFITSELSHNDVLFFSSLLNWLMSLQDLDEEPFYKKTTDNEDEVNSLFVNLQKEDKALYLNEAKALSSSVVDKHPLIEKSMLTLFQNELENQSKILINQLLIFEQAPHHLEALNILMRAAHSIKGAARVVSLSLIVDLTHQLENFFVAAQNGLISLQEADYSNFLNGIDHLVELAKIEPSKFNNYLVENNALFESFTNFIKARLLNNSSVSIQNSNQNLNSSTKPTVDIAFSQISELRIKAESLNRLMGLAGESVVESRWLVHFNDSLLQLKKNFNQLEQNFNQLIDQIENTESDETTKLRFKQLIETNNMCRLSLNQQIADLDQFILRHSGLSDRFYNEVIKSRMRDFGEGTEGFPRLVRDLSHHYHKKVHLEIKGKTTPVDRDILEKLEAPLSHLLRNAIDHGIELPDERQKKGKQAEGLITINAFHHSGILKIIFSDDGKGLDISKIKALIEEKGLLEPYMISKLTENEIIEFIFLPGFTTSTSLTEISGRGVGLDVVKKVVEEVGGSIKVTFIPGQGTTFSLQVPITLSVLRTLITEISSEPYAFPLSHIERSINVFVNDIQHIEGRQYINFEGDNIGLISASQILGFEVEPFSQTTLSVVIIKDPSNRYGIIVNKFLGEKELVVHELDVRLGKIQDISAGAFLEDGSPILIIDSEDLLRSCDKLFFEGELTKIANAPDQNSQLNRTVKRVLIVDDSPTVREVECRHLRNHGYEVETAINGIDGWNAMRSTPYDLVITDVDMPRMNGIDFIKTIRADTRLKDLPIIVVSYKEGEEDRKKGLEAGANCYLTKSSFTDETLIKMVDVLINPLSKD